MGNDSRRRLALIAAFLMAATALSRVLGLVREMVTAWSLGLSPEMGAFTVAFKAPSLVWTMVSDTALSAAFIPVFSELLVKGRRQEAWRVAGSVAFLAALLLGVISLAGMVFARQVVFIMAPGFQQTATASTISLAVELTRVMFPLVLLLGLSAVCTGILNSYDHFGLPAAGPILWNVIIVGFVVFAAFASPAYTYRATFLAWGVVAGTLLQLGIQVPAVLRRREPGGGGLDLKNPAVRRVGLLAGPVVLSLGLVNFNWLVNTIFASYISVAAPAVIDKAFRLFQLPQGVFAVALGTVLLPSLSRLGAERKMEEFRSTLGFGIRQVFFLTLPFTAFFLVLGEPTVRLIYERGAFVAADTAAVTWALYFFSLSMAFVSANTLLTRGFYGVQKTWPPLIMGVVNLGLNVVFNWLFYRPLGVGGITLATSLVTICNFAGLFWLLHREIGSLNGRGLARGVALTMLACVPLAGAGFGAWWGLDRLLGRSVLGQLGAVAGGYLVGLAAYAAAARLLRLPEMQQVLDLVRRRRSQGRASQAEHAQAE